MPQSNGDAVSEGCYIRRSVTQVTIAVVQFECHQAALLGSNDFLQEPFVCVDIQHAEKLPLQQLADCDFTVADVQQTCRETYIRWAKTRLESVICHLKDIRPDIVVFPEYSVPLDHLHVLHDYARDNHVTVFAGTHSPPVLTEEVARQYETLGIDRSQIRALLTCDLPSKSIMPVFFHAYDDANTGDLLAASQSNFSSRIYSKEALSVFEFGDWGETEASLKGATPHSDAADLVLDVALTPHIPPQSKGKPIPRRLRVLPRICAEALRLRPIPPSDRYDLVAILAYHHPVKSFDAEIHRHIVNKKPVILCNDGRFGGSRIAIHPDVRPVDSWWLRDEGALPPGDACLIAQLDMSQLAIQLGCNNPAKPFDLIELSAVLPRNNASPSSRAAQSVHNLRQSIRRFADWKVDRAEGTETDLELQAVSPKKSANGPENVFDEDRLTRILETILQGGELTELQRLKIRRLLRLKTHDVRTWNIHASDILYNAPPSANSQSGMTGQPLDLDEALDLRGLEAMLSQYCLTQIRALNPDRPLSDQESGVLHAVRKRLSRVAGVRESVQIESVVRQFFGRVSREARRDALRQLTDRVGELVERYEGTAAWLYRVSDADEIRLVVAHNTPFRPKSLSEGDSLVKDVANNKRSAFYGEIVYRSGQAYPIPFKPVKTSTRSAIAVPLFRYPRSPNDSTTGLESKVLGVLTIESNQIHTFSIIDLIELEREATRLVEELLIIDYYEKWHGQMIWRPQSWDWNRSQLHNAFSYELCSAVPDSDQVPGFGCTLWFADHGIFQNTQTPSVDISYDVSGYARGVSRFDYEYVARRAMPLYRVVRTAGKTTKRAISFTGEVVLAKPKTVLRQDWRKHKLFQRQMKAERMELKEVLGCPVYRRNEQDWLNPDGKPASGDDGTDLVSLGALNLYFYEDEYGQRLEQTADLLEPVLPRICSALGRSIHNAREITIDVAIAALRSRLENYALIGQNQFNIIRDFLMSVFETDGCSIFHRERAISPPDTTWKERLKCVSTTGLSQNGSPIDESHIFYDLELSLKSPTEQIDEHAAREKFRSSPHFTVRLLDRPGVPMRQNFQYEPFNREEDPNSLIPARWIEGFLLSEHEHRRVLAFAVPDPLNSSRAIGVIRLIRSLRRKPFMDADADLLVHLAPILAHAFLLRKKQQAIPLPVDGVLQIGYPQLFKAWSGRFALRQPGLEQTLCRVMQMSYGFARWSRCRVEAVLQDLFYVLRPHNVLLASLRFVSRAPRGGKQLKLFAFQSRSQLQPPDEPAQAPLTDREGGVGWSAIRREEILAFKYCEESYGEPGHRSENESTGLDDNAPVTLLFDEQAARLSGGICIPFVLYFRGRPAWALLSVDFATQEALQLFYDNDASPELVHLILRAVFKLVMMSTGENADSRVQGRGDSYNLEQLWSDHVELHLKRREVALRKDLGIAWLKYRFLQGVGEQSVERCKWQEADDWHDSIKRAENGQVDYSTLMSRLKSTPDPRRALESLVDRSFPQLSTSTTSEIPHFCRFPVEIADQVDELSAVGATLDFKNFTYVIPLYLGPLRVVELLGGFDPMRPHASMADRRTLAIRMLEEIIEIQSLWNDFAASPAAFESLWTYSVKRRKSINMRDDSTANRLWTGAAVWDASLRYDREKQEPHPEKQPIHIELSNS